MRQFQLTKLSAVLFDLDGTLIDTAPDFIYVLQSLLTSKGFPVLEEKTIRNCVSNGSKALIKLAFDQKVAPTEMEGLRQQLLDQYLTISGRYAILFPGMEELLSLLENNAIPWGIITNKPRKFSEDLLQKLKLTNRCSVLICPDDVKVPKPSPESMYLAAKKLQIALENAIYIGDHERDIASGKAAGMGTIAASYGYIEDKAQVVDWKADIIIDSPMELRQLFLA